MTPSDSDRNLWFEREVQPHEGPLRAWLRGQFPALIDLDDLVQEAYARILEAYARAPEDMYAAKAFLYATARNLALDRLRRAQIVRFDTLPPAEAPELAEDLPGVFEIVSRRQELQLLTEAIQALPERCRQVLTLKKIYGLPQREIAEQLGITEHTVEAQVGLGVRRCAEYLARFGLP